MDGAGDVVNGMEDVTDVVDGDDDRDVLDDVRCSGGNNDCDSVGRIGK